MSRAGMTVVTQYNGGTSEHVFGNIYRDRNLGAGMDEVGGHRVYSMFT
jgi:hypothetical protein